MQTHPKPIPFASLRRRTVLSSAGWAFISSALPVGAIAQSADAQPIKMIVPFPPGGSNDGMARVVSAQLAKELKQPVVVDNRSGASGMIGTAAVVRALPDGQTLLFSSSSISTNVAVNKKMAYDIERDLQPIARVGAGPLVLVINKNLPAENIQDLARLSRTKKLTYGSSGTGGYQHLATELINLTAGIDGLHVPYRGNGHAFTDLMAGQLDVILATLDSAVPLIRNNQAKVLAVTGGARSPVIPSVPTLAEVGLPGLVLEGWWGVFAPAKTPPAIVDRLHAAIVASMASAPVTERFMRDGTLPVVGTPAQLAELMRAEVVLWQKVVKDARISVE